MLCWIEAIAARRAAEHAAYLAEAAKMDAEEYGANGPAIAQEARQAADDAAAKMKAFQEVHKKCAAMSKS